MAVAFITCISISRYQITEFASFESAIEHLSAQMQSLYRCKEFMMENLKVVILGVPGSGKTVFLASMYHKLSIPSRERGFYLSLSPTQSKALTAKFETLGEGKWPRPNLRAEISEWVFTCNIQTPDYDAFPAFSFTYYDYAGERLTDANSDEDRDHTIDDAIRTADALLGIVDGHKIYAMMTNSPMPGRNSVNKDLANILPRMAQSRNPVHLLITKWDILEKKFTLGEIRDYLMQNDQFADFVENRKYHHHPARIIPVSSIGINFADLQSDGAMAIRSGANPRPFQMELPIACIIPDYLRSIAEQKAAEEIRIMIPSSSKTTVGLKDALKRLAVSLIRNADKYVGKLPPQYKFAGAALASIGQSVTEMWESDIQQREKYLQVKVEELRFQRDKELAKVKDEGTAAKQALLCFERLMYDLDRAFPDSNLAK